jgi:endonuclease/exonuclease/phosphatase family metal-dependent hydrolase
MITLNCFGVPTISTGRRLLALAHQLNSQPFDVICFQEVQSNFYRTLLLKACSTYGSNAYQPFVHAPKGGLLTLARTPISSAQFVLYEARGRWYSPAVADWILHKGALITRMKCDSLPVVVINTHLNANYRGNWEASNHYSREEKRQLHQLAEIVSVQPHDALVIVAGDFNIPRGSTLYNTFVAESGLTDAMAGDMRPTFRLPKMMPDRYAMPIDFAYYRVPDLPGSQVHSDLHFQDKIPLKDGRTVYPSDHYAVALNISWEAETQILPST